MGYDNPLQNEYEGFRQRAARIEGNWCNDCHGYTHMPWCSEYVEPLTDLQKAVIEHDDDMARLDRNTLASEQPASATGSEWLADGDIHGGFVWQGRALLATTIEATRAHQIATDHNQHQQCAEQLRFLGNRAEELSSLLAGMTTERDEMREALQRARGFICEVTWGDKPKRKREAEALVIQINAALNHAEQGEGSDG